MSAAPPAAKRMKREKDGGARHAGKLPAHERLLGDWGTQASVLAPRWLVRAQVSLPGVPSPAAVQGTRVAVSRVHSADSLGVYVASNACVYSFALAWPAARAPEQGKEGVLKPTSVAGGLTKQLSHMTLRSEVQALDCAALQPGAQLLAAVDAYGTVVISRSSSAHQQAGANHAADGGQQHAAVGDADGGFDAISTVTPVHASSEPSWAGVAFAPGAPHVLATARHLARAVDVYDGDLHAMCIHTPGYPTALTFLPPTSAASAPGTLLAVAEAHNVCIYDVRAGNSSSSSNIAVRFAGALGSCIQALATAPSPAGCALLATSGSERALTVYDCRTNRALRRHNGVMRKEVLTLAFSTVDARWIYAAGADNEIVCRRWDVVGSSQRQAEIGGEDEAGTLATAPTRQWACRGDARWMGLAVAPHHQDGAGTPRADIMAAFSASGFVSASHVT